MAVICKDVETKSSRRISGLWNGKKTVSHNAVSSVTSECQEIIRQKSPQEQGVLEQTPGKMVCIWHPRGLRKPQLYFLTLQLWNTWNERLGDWRRES